VADSAARMKILKWISRALRDWEKGQTQRGCWFCCYIKKCLKNHLFFLFFSHICMCTHNLIYTLLWVYVYEKWFALIIAHHQGLQFTNYYFQSRKEAHSSSKMSKANILHRTLHFHLSLRLQLTQKHLFHQLF